MTVCGVFRCFGALAKCLKCKCTTHLIKYYFPLSSVCLISFSIELFIHGFKLFIISLSSDCQSHWNIYTKFTERVNAHHLYLQTFLIFFFHTVCLHHNLWYYHTCCRCKQFFVRMFNFYLVSQWPFTTMKACPVINQTLAVTFLLLRQRLSGIQLYDSTSSKNTHPHTQCLIA